MVYIKKQKSEKISKGYRLNPKTHKLIDELQIILKLSQDEVIYRACEKLFSDIKKSKKNEH